MIILLIFEPNPFEPKACSLVEPNMCSASYRFMKLFRDKQIVSVFSPTCKHSKRNVIVNLYFGLSAALDSFLKRNTT